MIGCAGSLDFNGMTRTAWQLMESLFPICRSITGNGVRRSLDAIEKYVHLQRTELTTGTRLFDWEVPNEWNIREAYVADADGRRVIDFAASTLHVVNYSCPVRARLTREELDSHLHSIPERPDWVPYRTSYYKADWGFCLAHRDRLALGPGPFDVVVDSTLGPGSLTLAECVIPGTTGGEAIVYTHTCHPSLANDNLTGMAAATVLARELSGRQPRLTWRFVFGPGTIGSLAWLSLNESRLSTLKGGLTIGLLGDSGPITYKQSRRGDSPTDRAADLVLAKLAPGAITAEFEPYGYDERQFCSPGFNLPIGRLTRSVNGGYPEYHTSADDLTLVQPSYFEESIRILTALIAAIDQNATLVNLSPKGEPRLGTRGLYGAMGGVAPGDAQMALLWVLNLSDSHHDLLSIARRSGLEVDLIARAAAALVEVGLAAEVVDGRVDAAGTVQ